MEPITWGVIIRLVIEVGWPAAKTMIQNAQKNAPVTPQEWAALEAKIETTGESLIPQRPGA